MKNYLAKVNSLLQTLFVLCPSGFIVITIIVIPIIVQSFTEISEIHVDESKLEISDILPELQKDKH